MPEEKAYSRASNIQSTGGSVSSYKGDALKASRRAKTTQKVLSGVGIALGALAIGLTAGGAAPVVLGLTSLAGGAAGMGASGAAAKKGSIDEYLASSPNPTSSSRSS